MPLNPDEFDKELKGLPAEDEFADKWDTRVKEIGGNILVISQIGMYGMYSVELFDVGDNINNDNPKWEDDIEFFNVRSVGVDKLFNGINTEEDLDKLVKMGASDYLHKIAWT